MKSKTAQIAAIAVILIIALAVFWKVLAHPGRLMTPGEGDLANLYAPRKAFQIGEFHATGEMTLWDPYHDCGAPTVGNIQTAMFYPLYILFYLMPTDSAFGFIILLDLFLGGLFAFFLARALGLSVGSSALAAVAYMLGGAWTCRLFQGHIMIFNNLPWIPLGLLGAKKTFDAVGVRWSRAAFWALIVAVALAAQFLGGHTQFFVYSAMMLAAFCVFEAITRAAKARSLRPAAGLALLAGGAALACALVMIQLLPAREFSEHVLGEEGRDVRYAVGGGGFTPPQWITLVLPDYYGRPGDGTYWGESSYWELGAYSGAALLVMAVVAVILGRGKYIWFFLGAGILVFLCSIGPFSPAFWLLQKIPFISIFRFPGRIFAMASLPLAIVAAYGAEAIFASQQKTRRRTSLLVAIFFTMIAAGGLIARPIAENSQSALQKHWKKPLAKKMFPVEQPLAPKDLVTLQERLDALSAWLDAWLLRVAVLSAAASVPFWIAASTGARRWLAWLVVAVVAVDLGVYAESFIYATPVEEVYPNDYFLLKEFPDNENGRNYRISLYYANVDYKQLRRRRFNVTGGDIDSSKLEYARQYLDSLDVLQNDLSGALNVRYILTPQRPKAAPQLSLVQAEDVFVVEDKNDFGRAYVVRHVVPVPASEPGKALEILSAGKIMRQTATVEGEVDFPLNNPGEFKKAQIVEYHANRIKVKVDLDEPGLLVLSEIWYPGWKAIDECDGARAEKKVYKTNYALRGVFLEKGEHTIEFIYDPASYKIGKAITFAALALLAAGLAITYFLSRRPSRK